jgi:calcineurin-like phosphoesterase family protein
MSRIVLTDPHGCYKTLLALVAKLPAGIPLTFAGDLIDRGPDSKSVIEFVKSGGHDCIVGNHEIMMLSELSFTNEGKLDYKVMDFMYGIWEMNGGTKCLNSYEDENGIMDVPTLQEHHTWLKTLPYFLEYPELKDSEGRHLLVTHSTAASVWGKVPTDSDQFKDNVTWERTPFPKKIKDIYNVYGHTPQGDKATIQDHFACIDTGAYYNRKPYGKLTALQFPEMIVYEQENVEDKK